MPKNRERPIQIMFYVSERERDFIYKKMALAKTKNKAAYLRKMACDGYVLKVDFSDVRQMIFLLSNSSNNLNQIARRVNSGDVLHATDIQTLQADYEKLWEQVSEILKKLSKL